MDKKTSNQPQKDQQANYNPTARNFDQKNVSGEPEKINSTHHDADDVDEDLTPGFDEDDASRGTKQ